eukprot:8379322-Ditylum_brightwellii.AAC.1
MDECIVGISVGLFAYFGPYVVQISALFLGEGHAEEVSLIKPGKNAWKKMTVWKKMTRKKKKT